MKQNKKIHNPEHLFEKGVITNKNELNFSFNKEKIKKCVNALASKETSCIIYGDKGAGKSSFATQVLSILTGDNPTYKKSDILNFDAQRGFKCISFTCTDQMSNFYDVLLNILQESPQKNSLYSIIPELYKEKLEGRKVENEIAFDLKIISGKAKSTKELTAKKESKVADEATFTATSANQKVFKLFNDVIGKVKKKYPDETLVIFIDEIDKIGNKSGIGSLLKNSEDCKFVFIGIADNITDIIDDHSSAGRKLIGGDIEIEWMTDSEIEYIFTNAESISNGGIKFSKEFLAAAIHLSNGIPWIAQNIGYESVNIAISKGYSPNETILITGELLKAAFESVKTIYYKEEKIVTSFDFEKITPLELDVLKCLLASKRSLTISEIREQIKRSSTTSPAMLILAIERFQKTEILRKTSRDTVKFQTHIIRILVRFMIDSRKN